MENKQNSVVGKVITKGLNTTEIYGRDFDIALVKDTFCQVYKSLIELDYDLIMEFKRSVVNGGCQFVIDHHYRFVQDLNLAQLFKFVCKGYIEEIDDELWDKYDATVADHKFRMLLMDVVYRILEEWILEAIDMSREEVCADLGRNKM